MTLFSKSRSIIHSITVLSLALAASACGGSQPEAKSADSDADADKAGAGEEKASETAAAAKPAAEAPKKEEAKPEESAPAVTRTPKDVLTAPDIAFMLAFNDSDAKKKAEEKCAEQSKGDPKKQNSCIGKERDKIEIDGLQFKQENGAWFWSIIHKKGSKVTVLHKVQIEFGAETDKAITILPKGKDKGRKPWGNVPKEVKIEVPSEYQIAMEDPQYGRLAFDVKIGIVGESQ